MPVGIGGAAPSAPFATAADLATFLQRDLSAAETATATLLLNLASDAIRAETNQSIALVPGDVATLFGNWSPRLVLPERPVIAVIAVSINGIALVADVDYWWPGKYRLIRGARPSGSSTHDIGRGDDWGGPDMAVVVTYSHGFAVIPDVVRAVCLSAARRSMVNPDGALSLALNMTAGSVATTYGADGGAGATVELTPGEKASLAYLSRSWQ